MNSKNPHFHSIIVGGGAAGFFTAINSKEKNPNFNIAILEKGQNVLTKVRISGGGRCNLTNACRDVNEFVNNYPRGAKELMGPLKRFGNKETMQWFEKRGVLLKTQEDGRVFPQSDQSESIINCFLERANALNISIFKEQSVKDFQKNKQGIWEIITQDHTFYAENLVITTGSNIKMWQLLEKLGFQYTRPKPPPFDGHSFACASKNKKHKHTITRKYVDYSLGIEWSGYLKIICLGFKNFIRRKVSFCIDSQLVK